MTNQSRRPPDHPPGCCRSRPKSNVTAGHPIEDADIARLSPLTWHPIDFLDRSDFPVSEPVTWGALRLLPNPDSEYDF